MDLHGDRRAPDLCPPAQDLHDETLQEPLASFAELLFEESLGSRTPPTSSGWDAQTKMPKRPLARRKAPEGGGFDMFRPLSS